MNYMSIIEFDKQRFDDLYQKYAGMIFRTAYNFLLNKDDAEDIVQEVFIRYFISNKTFNDDNHEKAWILTVTANLSKNVLRSKSRQNLELEIIEDNGDIKYCWSKMGYDNIINPYDSLTIRVDGLTGEIVTINRFDDEFDTNEINISETTAKNIALKTKDNFSKVTSCQIGYVKPNFFWKDTNKIYEDVKMVRLVYDIMIDDIYKVYIDTKTGENIGGDIIKATNNARAYAYSGFKYSTESRNLANTYLKKLGYSSSSVGINNTFKSNPVLSFVQNDTKAYGLYIDCHGSTTTLATNSQTILTTNQVKGNWHFVFLDACSTAANSNWPNAFKINSSYSKRAFFGWTTSVYTDKSYDFCRYFWPETTNRNHSNNVRDAAVWAADQVPNNSDGSASTPIRFYGDRSYNGRAY